MFSVSSFSVNKIAASQTSLILCGGMFVAIPTAIPELPLTNKFGNLAGKTNGSFVVLSKRVLSGIPSETLAVYTYLIASLILSPFALTTNLAIPLTAWLLLVILGVINTAIAVTIYFYGLKQIKAQEAAVLTYIEPASAVIYGMIFLGQLPSSLTLIGGIFIVVAGVLVTVKGGTSS